MSNSSVNTDLHQLRKHTQGVFAALYRIDIAELNPSQREQHQQQLSTAYMALVKLENAQLSQLTQEAKASLVGLQAAMANLAQRVDKAKHTVDVLTTVAKGVDALSDVLKWVG
ncbi:MAG TPA: hypothetical protein VGE55_01140 [Limnobacter sp.]|uniref:hypothetical protein n=1 Tax=Limnobacter sp. TaxID=2003368 RepID=UPI002ED7C26A